jgi:hypothetical protein
LVFLVSNDETSGFREKLHRGREHFDHGTVLDTILPSIATKPIILRTHEGYQIGIVCTLAHEKAAVEAMLNEEHPRLKRKEHDVNYYTLG